MAETLNVTIDDLPELGTKAAAVESCASLIFYAVNGDKPVEAVQLRYWLDLYYQVRKAAEEARAADSRPYEEPRAVGDAGPYKVTEIPEEQLREVEELHDYLHGVIRKAAKAAGIEIEDEAGPPRASAPTVETEDSAATEDAAETQQTAEPAAKAQRQRPVGWTDGFEPVELKKSGAAEAAAFKREQLERLQRFLREGVTMQQIVKAVAGNITEDQILGIRECRRVPVAVYRVLEAALDRIETD